MTEKAPLRIHRTRKERPGDEPRDVYEVDRPHLTMQHVAPVVETLPCPDSVPESMRNEWELIVRTMGATGMLSPMDMPVLETAFLAIDLQRQASRTLHQDGPTIYDAKGQAVPHPAIAIMKNASKTIIDCSKQLGWDVVTRIKNPIPEVPTTDPNDPARLLTGG